VGIEVRTPSDRPIYALGTLDLRPGIAIVGDAGFLFDARLKARGAYIIIQGQDIDMRVFADFDFGFDNAAYQSTAVPEVIERVAFWEVSGSAGMSLRF
jgi:hypothetical protein